MIAKAEGGTQTRRFNKRKYGELLTEYDRAIEQIEKLIKKGDRISAEEEYLLDLLATAPNALPYQTQINNTLRAAMMADRGIIVEVEDEGAALHTNPTFIKDIAKSVKEQLAQERKRQRKRA